jgi:hypothetical protein
VQQPPSKQAEPAADLPGKAAHAWAAADEKDSLAADSPAAEDDSPASGAADAGGEERPKQAGGLSELIGTPEVIRAADAQNVVWARVRGFPHWPVRARTLLTCHQGHA